MKVTAFVCVLLLLASATTTAFRSSTGVSRTFKSFRKSLDKQSTSSSSLQVSFPIDHHILEDVKYKTRDEVKPIIKFGTGETEKVVNAFGIWCLAVTAITGVFWVVAMTTVSAASKVMPGLDPDKALYDKTGKIWSKIYLSLTDSYPTQSGNTASLKRKNGACLYVANHASWLDIPIVCTVLDPVFKFIAKEELSQAPMIGQQLTGGGHILLNRDDKRSQLKSFKDSIKWLKSGVPIMAFPEGKRSHDGKLADFKQGVFSMAVKCNVPIVPLTICNAHAVMPGYALFPIQPGLGKLHVHVHDAIDTKGKSEEVLAQLVKEAFLSQLPQSQLPDVKPTRVQVKMDEHSFVNVHAMSSDHLEKHTPTMNHIIDTHVMSKVMQKSVKVTTHDAHHEHRLADAGTSTAETPYFARYANHVE